MRNLIVGFVMVFFITLSIPMFSVSVFPTMQSPFGFMFARTSASSTLESVETATGQPEPLQNAKYSPGTGGHVFSITSKPRLNESVS
jgi:hypothetical protein